MIPATHAHFQGKEDREGLYDDDERMIKKLRLRDDTFYDGIGSILSLRYADADSLTDITFMECYRSKKDIVGFCICRDLIFLSIFSDDSDLTLVWDLTDDFIEDFSLRLYRSLELTSLYEKRLRRIVLWYWIYIPIGTKHSFPGKDAFDNFIISRSVRRKSIHIEICAHSIVFSEKR